MYSYNKKIFSSKIQEDYNSLYINTVKILTVFYGIFEHYKPFVLMYMDIIKKLEY